MHYLQLCPEYSPDVAHSDYHLFRSMAHRLEGINFQKFKDNRKFMDDFIASKLASFYRDGTRMLPNHWRQVVEYNG